MVELRCRDGFTTEALSVLCGRETTTEDDLERHEAIERQLPSLEHDAHPAAAGLLEDLVVIEPLPDRDDRILRRFVAFLEPTERLVVVEKLREIGREIRMQADELIPVHRLAEPNPFDVLAGGLVDSSLA